ncbi:hypothetical protein OC845_005232 [Tilletia horrida]|nr:hypothetical protein OC845_005232 [Tilletia horrida]
MSLDQHKKPATTLLDLPPELLSLIALALLPASPKSSSSSSSSSSVPYTALPSTAYLRSLYAFAQTSRATASAALPVLYSILILRRTRQVTNLAHTLQRHSHLANRVTDLYLTPHDGLREANDRREDADGWQQHVRSLFDCCKHIEHLCLTSMSTGSALQNFLHPHTHCTPTEITIHNYSASTPDFSSLNLEPLANAQYLHLVQIRLTRPLLDFFHGFDSEGNQRKGKQSNAESSSSSSGSQPHPITHLRLSSVHRYVFDGLPAYIEKREAVMDRQSSPSSRGGLSSSAAAQRERRRARTSDEVHPDTGRLFAGQRQGWAQETLYNLAADADLLPNLRLVLIELQPMDTLAEPSYPMEREQPNFNLVGADPLLLQQQQHPFTSTQGQGAPFDQYAGLGQLATIDFPSDVPVSTVEAEEWLALEHEARLAEERQRTAHRDAYWLRVREGKEALLNLFRQARASLPGHAEGKKDDFELRIVASRAGGWSYSEAQSEFASAAFSPSRRNARGSRLQLISSEPEGSEGSDMEQEWGCWTDEDVFELAATRPWLGLEKGKPGNGGDAAQDSAGWWTGELPRLNASGPDTPSSA